jgi:hypothetical protein
VVQHPRCESESMYHRLSPGRVHHRVSHAFPSESVGQRKKGRGASEAGWLAESRHVSGDSGLLRLTA